MDTSSEGLATALHKCRTGRSADRPTAGACSSSASRGLSVATQTLAGSWTRERLRRIGPPAPSPLPRNGSRRACVRHRLCHSSGTVRHQCATPPGRGRARPALSGAADRSDREVGHAVVVDRVPFSSGMIEIRVARLLCRKLARYVALRGVVACRAQAPAGTRIPRPCRRALSRSAIASLIPSSGYVVVCSFTWPCAVNVMRSCRSM